MNVMLLCAGIGSRLQPYTNTIPKPCIPFLGAPLASYSLALLNEIQINNLVVNTHHLPDQIKSFFQKQKITNLHFTFEKELLGSGGGIHNAKKYLNQTEDFLVMNGDEVILPMKDELIKDFVNSHKKSKAIATLLTTAHPDVGTKFGGAWADQNNKVQQFSKTVVPGLKGHHFVGVMVLSPKVFNYFKSSIIEENILYETLTSAIAKGETVNVYDAQMQWFETGNPKDFIAASEFCLSNLNGTDHDYWVRYLKSVISKYGDHSLHIENDFPEIAEKVRKIWNTRSSN